MIFLLEEQYSGPLPHPKHLEDFERIQPGSADRILRMVEAERHYAFAGLYSGLTFAVLVIAAGVACAVIGAKEIGIGFVSVGFVGVVAQFINGRKRRATAPNLPAQDEPVDGPDRVRRRAAGKGTRQAQKRRTKY